MHTRTLAQLAGDLRARRVSATELARHFLARIERFDEAAERVHHGDRGASARASRGGRPAAREGRGDAAHGHPARAQGHLLHAGVKTSCGSRMLDNFVAPYDATVVERLQNAGAVMLGKTNMDEFAMGSSNETSFYGPVRNPWNHALVPGGSSGGSAAAVAARHRAGGDGHGHGRLDSSAGRALRHHGHQADVRARVALRHDRVRVEPRSGRRADADGRGRGAAARSDGRLRRARLDVARRARAALLADRRRAVGRHHDRRARELLRRRARRRQREGAARRARGARKARREVEEHRAARTFTCRCPRTTSSRRPRRRRICRASTACASAIAPSPPSGTTKGRARPART